MGLRGADADFGDLNEIVSLNDTDAGKLHQSLKQRLSSKFCYVSGSHKYK